MKIATGIALASHRFNASAQVRQKQQKAFTAAADAKPAHAGIDKVATKAGFVAQEHSQGYDNPKQTQRSTYAHGDGRTLNVASNGNWTMTQQGAGADTLTNVINAGSEDTSEHDDTDEIDAGGPGSGKYIHMKRGIMSLAKKLQMANKLGVQHGKKAETWEEKESNIEDDDPQKRKAKKEALEKKYGPHLKASDHFYKAAQHYQKGNETQGDAVFNKGMSLKKKHSI